MFQTDEKLEKILKYLPPRAENAFAEYCRKEKNEISEVRLRAEAPASLTADGKNVFCFGGEYIICQPREISETLAKLCEDSVHTYAETINDGYAMLSGGYRIGVCGIARSEGERVRGIYSVSSLCIRIPHAVRGVCDRLLREITSGGRIMSSLIYSPPGVGKTTLLRDAASTLSSGSDALRVCIIDTRGEIYMKEMFAFSIADVLSGYPRAKGMEIAARTMSSQLVVCDEIGTDEEATAILSVQNSGVPLLASAHASDMSGLMRRPNIKKLLDAGIFERCIGIAREDGKFRLSVSKL